MTDAQAALVDNFLAGKLRSHDALLLVAQVSGPQEFIGHVERIYSTKFEGPARYDQGAVAFVGSPASWGNRVLADGERAIVFIRWLAHSGKYYQDHWHGHLTVSDGDRGRVAIANWRMVGPGEGALGREIQSPEILFPLSMQEPHRTAMAFEFLESRLMSLGS